MKTTGSRASAVSQTRGFGDLLYDKAGSRPSLDLDFAGTSSLRDKITGENLVDHTRASKGTYIGSDGLIKSATTNLFVNSQLNTLTSWNKGANTTFTPNYAEAPDGTQTAHRIQHAANTGTYIGQTVSGLTSGKTYVFSFWWKRNGTDTEALIYHGGASHVHTIPAEWTRFYVVFQTSSTSFVQFDNIGSTASDYLIWHPQFEEGNNDPNTPSTPTDYVETVSTINSAPRFTHERVETGNLLTDTNRFLNDWNVVSNASLIPYAALAPDGTYSAINFKRAAVAGHIYQNLTLTAGKTYTASAYVKSTGTSSDFNFWAYDSNGYLGQTTQTATPTEWTRYEFTFTPASNSTGQSMGFGSGSFASDHLFWGVQLEEANSASTAVQSIDTFTSRASNATYVDSAGLIKTSAVNKIHNSDFVNSWARDAGLSPSNHRNDVVNPFGETEVQKVLELSHSNTTAQSVWYQTGSGKGTGFLSVYAKANTWSNLNFGGQTPAQTVSFNLSNGTINSSQGTTGSIENVGNGWYRCSVNIHTQTDWLIFQPHPDGATRVGSRIQLVGAGSIFLYGVMFESPSPRLSDFVENLTSSALALPRYSHDPETLTSTGLYLEPASTNLITRSNRMSDFGGASQTLNTTDVIAPDGTNTALSLNSIQSGFAYGFPFLQLISAIIGRPDAIQVIKRHLFPTGILPGKIVATDLLNKISSLSIKP